MDAASTADDSDVILAVVLAAVAANQRAQKRKRLVAAVALAEDMWPPSQRAGVPSKPTRDGTSLARSDDAVVLDAAARPCNTASLLRDDTRATITCDFCSWRSSRQFRWFKIP